jgi:hypothetical protein
MPPMKYLIILLSCFLSLSAQKIPLYNLDGKSEKKFDENSKRPLTVLTWDDKEFDDALKFAFAKYWKFGPVNYMSDAERNKKGTDLDSYLYISGASWNESPNIHAFKLIWYGVWKTNKPSLYEVWFDHLSKGDNENIGADITHHDFSNKIIQYVMLMSRQVKLVIEMGAKDYYRINNKSKLETLTILVSKESLAKHGLSEATFKTKFKKVEFISSDDIKKRLMEDKNLDNCAELFICQDTDRNSLFIMDLKTGDIIASSGSGKSGFNRMKKVDDDMISNMLSDLK